MLRPILAAMAALALGATPAAACEAPHVAKGTPYPKARQLLITQGYIPIATPADSKGPECQGEYAFAQCVYPEVDHCFGTGLAGCNYVYRCRATGRWIWAYTTGDASEASQLSDVRYSGWHPVSRRELGESFRREEYVDD